MAKRKAKAATKATGANVGYEAQLWQMADTLRGGMDAAEYKHVCLGLLFLKYISDAFEERHDYLKGSVDDPKDDYYLAPKTRNRTDPVTRLLEDPDEYRSQSTFWVPPRRAGPPSRRSPDRPRFAGWWATPWPASSVTTGAHRRAAQGPARFQRRRSVRLVPRHVGHPRMPSRSGRRANEHNG